jgi:aspartate-semialdehyde dehydrogenase
MGYKVAVVGATGNVGREMLNILDERKFPADEVVVLASRRSMGVEVSYGDRTLKVKALEHYDFSDVDICLMSAGGSVSKEWSPKIAAAGAVVIDNSSAWRMDPDVPLIVPEVNADAVGGFTKKNIIANPNCSTIQLVVALKPLYDAAGIERIDVATYQSVSGAGREALEELVRQSIAALSGKGPIESPGGAKQMAFNCVPHIDVFQDNGYTREEMKIVWETRKILALPELAVSATAARVPVRVGHAASVYAEFETPLSPSEAREAWRSFPGVRVVDDPATGRYPTPLEAAGHDDVLVGRARSSLARRGALEFFVASDNLRKGSALNAIQIAEGLAARAAAAR